MRKFSKKSIDAAVTGLSNARQVLDGTMEAPPNPWGQFEGVVRLRDEHIVEEPPLQEPPPSEFEQFIDQAVSDSVNTQSDWNHTRRDLG